MSAIINFALNGSNSAKTSSSEPKTLNIALYRHVPKLSQFKEVISKRWKTVEPDVPLNFVDWDCYLNDPCNEIDVFAFDGVYLPYFIEKGYLAPLDPDEIDSKDDIFSFILDACKKDSIIYGVPQLLCTKFLFYRRGDTCLQCVQNLRQLYKILGDNNSCKNPPDTNTGLLLNLFDGIIAACVYIETLATVHKSYSDFNITLDLDNLDEPAIGNLELLVSMVGKEQARYIADSDDPYIRASWFTEGRGRAYIGYTESIMNMKDSINNIDFKLFSWSNDCSSHVFYSDIVGISSSIADKDKRALAVKLVNTITSADTIEECIRPANCDKYPQYLMPVRGSVYLNLKSDFPIYDELFKLVTQPGNIVFRLGSESRQWISAISSSIRKKLGLADT